MDTSAFVKLFVSESGSAAMMSFVVAEPDANRIICALTVVEVRSALFRLRRTGKLDVDQVAQALVLVGRELLRTPTQGITPVVLDLAAKLVERHGTKTLDSLQLAAALVTRDSNRNRSIRFIASDKALLEAAAQEGFLIWDPCTTQ